MGWSRIGQHLIAGCKSWCGQQDRPPRPLNEDATERGTACPAAEAEDAYADDTDRLVSQLLAQSRYALLLRQQIADNLSCVQRERAQSVFLQATSLVPAGEVIVEPWQSDEDAAGADTFAQRRVCVEPLYLDRLPITNEQFREFVEAGGYEQESLWQPGVWPRCHGALETRPPLGASNKATLLVLFLLGFFCLSFGR